MTTKETNLDQKKIEQALAAIAKKIGPVPTVVLYNLITQFPDRMQLLDGVAVMKADPGAYLKLGLDSKVYYEAIAALQGQNLVREIRTDDKKFYYQINWEELDSFFEEPRPLDQDIQWELLEEEE